MIIAKASLKPYLLFMGTLLRLRLLACFMLFHRLSIRALLAFITSCLVWEFPASSLLLLRFSVSVFALVSVFSIFSPDDSFWISQLWVPSSDSSFGVLTHTNSFRWLFTGRAYKESIISCWLLWIPASSSWHRFSGSLLPPSYSLVRSVSETRAITDSKIPLISSSRIFFRNFFSLTTGLLGGASGGFLLSLLRGGGASFLFREPPLHELLECGLLRGGGVGGMVSCENVSLERDTRLLRLDRGGGVGLMSVLRTDWRLCDLRLVGCYQNTMRFV